MNITAPAIYLIAMEKGVITLPAILLIERIRAFIQEKLFDTNVVVTCSFGIASMKEDLSFEHPILKADEFMYHAKKQGKHSVSIVGFSENS